VTLEEHIIVTMYLSKKWRDFWDPAMMHMKTTLSLCVLFVCKCELHYCHRVAAQLQLTNVSICRHQSRTFHY
jgi:hypothetical protein